MTSPRQPRVRGRRSGIALVTALSFCLLAAMLFVAGIEFTRSALKQGASTKANAQVYNVALAGITAATNWLQRQAAQPVTCFDPQANTNSPDDQPETPPTEEQLGLVSEFEVDTEHGMWGRYEVGRSTTGPVPAPARAPVTQAGSHSSLYVTAPSWTAEDISHQRGQPAGTIWRVRSKGYIFNRTVATTPFSLSATPPIQTMTLEAEIRRGKFNYHEAAIYNFSTDTAPRDGNGDLFDIHSHDVSSNTVVASADGSGYVYWARTTLIQLGLFIPFTPPGPAILGANDPTKPEYVSSNLTDQLQYYFGVNDLATLKGLADRYYEDPTTLPQPTTSKPQFVYIKPQTNPIEFDGTNGTGADNNQLSGSGVLVIEGDMYLHSQTANVNNWSGLVFVTGGIQIQYNANITGGLVGGGYTFIHGYDTGPSHPAKVLYSPATLDSINAQMGSYRVMRSTIKPVDDSTATTY